MGSKAKPAMIERVGGELRVFYPDARIEPRVCTRTKILRNYCHCAPCRALRRRKHGATCSCWRCYSDRMGTLIDDLGRRTAAGRWLWFITMTFRTPHFPWAQGFPIEQATPSPDFVRHFFDMMIHWIEGQVHARVEYFQTGQFGDIGGRLHQHCGLSWPGLFEYRWKDLQTMLWERGGFNRILPWEKDAGFYIGRYIGRDAQRCDWDFRVGFEPTRVSHPVGREVIAHSAAPDLSSREFRRTLRSWHR
jgi:hypothetical protein